LVQPDRHWIADQKTSCKLWDPHPSPGQSIMWTGDCANGLAQGRGTLQWFNDVDLDQRERQARSDAASSITNLNMP
jgi:hypothetical protein